MSVSKTDIIAQLRREILPLTGFRPVKGGIDSNAPGLLGPINEAFPNNVFPVGAVHEFLAPTREDAAASGAFMTGIIASLMKNGGASLWIGSRSTLYPAALRQFGVAPENVIFIDLEKERDIHWAMDEALKCDGLAAVVGEMQELSFTASRRLQLAVEQSRVTGFIVRTNLRKLSTNACVTRWRVSGIKSEPLEGLPGVGFPSWKVELLKVRNGKPGEWNVEWQADRFRVMEKEFIESNKQEALSSGKGFMPRIAEKEGPGNNEVRIAG